MNPRERRDRAALEAAEWVLRSTSGEMNRSERFEYVSWLRESLLHVAQMLRVAGAHKQLTEFDGWSEMPAADPGGLRVAGVRAALAEAASRPRQSEPGPSPLAGEGRRAWRRVYAIAAAVAVIIVTLTYVALAPSNTVVAVAGQLRRVSLAGGVMSRRQLSLRWLVAQRFMSSSKPRLLQTALDAHPIQSRPGWGHAIACVAGPTAATMFRRCRGTANVRYGSNFSLVARWGTNIRRGTQGDDHFPSDACANSSQNALLSGCSKFAGVGAS